MLCENKLIADLSFSRLYSTVGNNTVPGLKVENVGKIARIEFNRPDKFNALNWEMYGGMIHALNQANQNKDISATVFTGN